MKLFWTISTIATVWFWLFFTSQCFGFNTLSLWWGVIPVALCGLYLIGQMFGFLVLSGIAGVILSVWTTVEKIKIMRGKS